MSSKEQVPSQCQILFLGPLQILSHKSFRDYFVNNSAYFNLSSLCNSLCRSSCSSSRSSTSSHCVRYCATGSSGNEVCKALMPPKSAPPCVTKETKKKKKKAAILIIQHQNYIAEGILYKNSSLDLLKLKVANTYSQIILLGLLTQAKFFIHIKQLYDHACSLLMRACFYLHTASLPKP